MPQAIVMRMGNVVDAGPGPYLSNLSPGFLFHGMKEMRHLGNDRYYIFSLARRVEF